MTSCYSGPGHVIQQGDGIVIRQHCHDARPRRYPLLQHVWTLPWAIHQHQRRLQ
jgi:hypothetical protein